MLILQSKLTLTIYLLKIILQVLQGFKHWAFGMKAFEDVHELLFVRLWDAFISDCESCGSLRVLDHVNL